LEGLGRLRVVLGNEVDRRTLALLQGHTVDVFPHEASVVWAGRLQCAPRLIFQSYSAYPQGLDALNEDTIRSGHAAERMLMQNAEAIDGRLLSFTSRLRREPSSAVEMRATMDWLVLQRGPNRCGASQLVRTIHADWGEPVAVPKPPDRQTAVYVRIHGVEPGGLDRIRSLLFRPTKREIVLDGARYQLLPGTAGDGLIMRAPAEIDFSRPFNVAPNASRIQVLRGGEDGSGGQPLRFDFYAQLISRPSLRSTS
jgi:hypothetical protein